jgi:hypothetical protein
MMIASRATIQTVKAPVCKQKEKIRTRWVTCLAAAVVLWTRAPARSGPAPLPPEEQELVNQAIVKGVEFLKLKQYPVGTWGDYSNQYQAGYSALPGLTLLECGVPPNHSVVRKAADYVRHKADALSATYDLALAILFLDRLGDEEDRRLIQTLALRLIAGQNLTGGWSYGCPLLSPADTRTLLAGLRGKVPVNALPDSLRGLAVAQNLARTPIPEPPPGSDNCNTHFAILAAWTAQRHGVPMKITMNLIARRFHISQNEDGSWGYEFKKGGGVAESPAMTCTGLLGLAIGEGLIQDYLAKQKQANDKDIKKLVQERQIKKGLEALAKHVGVPAGRTRDLPMGNLYFLWALERVGMLYSVQAVAGKNWYRWGAEILVANQKPEGHWEGGGYAGSSRVADTCMALLFLKRTNLTEELTKKLEGEVDKAAKDRAALPVQPATPPAAAPPTSPAPAATAPPPPAKTEPPAKAPSSPATPAPASSPPSSAAPAAPAGTAPTPVVAAPIVPSSTAPPTPEKRAGGKLWPSVLIGGAVVLVTGGMVLFLSRRKSSRARRSRLGAQWRNGAASSAKKSAGQRPRRAR